MTSNGFVKKLATAPAIPAHAKYHKCGRFYSYGLTIVFKFSFTHTTILVKGRFIKTVIGYDLNRPLVPSSFKMFLMHYEVD